VAELVDAFYWHIYRAQDILDLKDENSILLGTVDGLRANNNELSAKLSACDEAWKGSESRYLELCNELGVDYALEEPETVLQVVRRIFADYEGRIEVLERELAEGLSDDQLAKIKMACCPGDATAILELSAEINRLKTQMEENIATYGKHIEP